MQMRTPGVTIALVYGIAVSLFLFNIRAAEPAYEISQPVSVNVDGQPVQLAAGQTVAVVGGLSPDPNGNIMIRVVLPNGSLSIAQIPAGDVRQKVAATTPPPPPPAATPPPASNQNPPPTGTAGQAAVTPPALPPVGSPNQMSSGNNEDQTVVSLNNRSMTLSGKMQLHVTGTDDPLPGSSINFTSPDAWFFFDSIPPSKISSFLSRFQVNGERAEANTNIRVAQYANGTVIIPQGSNFVPMTIFNGKSLAGASMPLKCYVKYDNAQLGTMKGAIGSLLLKRGYMATIAENEDGTGVSRNYVAQDSDVIINELPDGLDKSIKFIRIFPWRWTSKKGVSADLKFTEKLNVKWYYNWNISRESTPELEYVPIAQKMGWPDIRKQDWKRIGSPNLLGYNEPDHKDQSNLTVDQALKGWPDLLATGLRVGSPAVSDGGTKWLFDFVDKAEKANLRVDFVVVHYYRSYSNPADPRGAAQQFYNYLKQIHDQTHRPIWITEFNNGANWTKDPKPTVQQQKATIAAFVEMLDKTPFVERYAIYNWVEDVRYVQGGTSEAPGALTPAGEVYRDKVSPMAYVQPPVQK